MEAENIFSDVQMYDLSQIMLNRRGLGWVTRMDSSLATRSEVHNGDASASLTYTFSNQSSLDSLYQASSIAASQSSTDMSCIHEGEVRELQLCLNEPTA